MASSLTLCKSVTLRRVKRSIDSAPLAAGRFGTRGIAITFVAQKEETQILNQVQERFDVGIDVLPEWDKIDKSSYTNA